VEAELSAVLVAPQHTSTPAEDDKGNMRTPVSSAHRHIPRFVSKTGNEHMLAFCPTLEPRSILAHISRRNDVGEPEHLSSRTLSRARIAARRFYDLHPGMAARRFVLLRKSR
jgi:hypothetical protein